MRILTINATSARDLPDTSFPTLAETAMALCPIDDYQASLLDTEQQAHRAMGSHIRRLQYGSGRHCIRHCQKSLGVEDFEIPRSGRVPRWPEGWQGSISHSQSLACGVLSRSTSAIGVDVEQQNRIDPNRRKLLQSLFTPTELRHIGSLADDRLWTLAFGAKEAAYKAVYSLNRDYIGFHEVNILIEPGDRTFSIQYLGDKSNNTRLDSGRGYWDYLEDHNLCLFVIS
ncbi:MAG: 4'-phosphopantetheinyl transferase superfamily protein [Pseudomonadota bacterium]